MINPLSLYIMYDKKMYFTRIVMCECAIHMCTDIQRKLDEENWCRKFKTRLFTLYTLQTLKMFGPHTFMFTTRY